MKGNKKGLLLINLGTTEAPTPLATGNYLKEFLMDPYVIDIPWLFRWILVNIMIVSKRKYSSAQAYHEIWTTEGSPLLVNSIAIRDKFRDLLKDTQVELAMRYGKPSIESTLLNFRNSNISELNILPLYPHFADSTWTTAIDCVKASLDKLKWSSLDVKWAKPYFSDSVYIDSLAHSINERLKLKKYDHLLFSYHGLPVSHLTKRIELKEHCLKIDNCCESPGEALHTCYRAQCVATTKLVQKKIINKEAMSSSIAFQSRLGKAEWLKPALNETLSELIKIDKKRVLICSPSFITDCLETLEELGIRARDEFLNQGGEELDLVECLNSKFSLPSSFYQP